jgi:hypothetical protein
MAAVLLLGLSALGEHPIAGGCRTLRWQLSGEGWGPAGPGVVEAALRPLGLELAQQGPAELSLILSAEIDAPTPSQPTDWLAGVHVTSRTEHVGSGEKRDEVVYRQPPVPPSWPTREKAVGRALARFRAQLGQVGDLVRQRLAARLSSYSFGVTIESVPPGAAVLVGTEIVGHTPMSVGCLPRGKRLTGTLSLAGYESSPFFAQAGGQTARCSIPLKQPPKPSWWSQVGDELKSVDQFLALFGLGLATMAASLVAHLRKPRFRLEVEQPTSAGRLVTLTSDDSSKSTARKVQIEVGLRSGMGPMRLLPTENVRSLAPKESHSVLVATGDLPAAPARVLVKVTGRFAVGLAFTQYLERPIT